MPRSGGFFKTDKPLKHCASIVYKVSKNIQRVSKGNEST